MLNGFKVAARICWAGRLSEVGFGSVCAGPVWARSFQVLGFSRSCLVWFRMLAVGCCRFVVGLAVIGLSNYAWVGRLWLG